MYNDQSRVLVLGSFPSALSRASEFYYGNPRNRFWRVVAAFLDTQVPQSIEGKRELLLSGGLALWDVIASCDIKGSSDASIKNVVPTDIDRVMAGAPVSSIICNGKTAGRLYHIYLEHRTGLPAVVLPSTSPANAAWSEDRLKQVWIAALTEASKREPDPGQPQLPGSAAHG